MYELINFLLYILCIPLVVLVHEFGHATFVMLFRQKVIEISLGVGKEIFRMKKIVIRKQSWWRGYCSWENIDSLATYKKLLIYLGGIIFNVSTAIVIWIFGNEQYANWYRGYIVVSYSTALFSIIPYKYFNPTMESDGKQCINLINSVKREI